MTYSFLHTVNTFKNDMLKNVQLLNNSRSESRVGFLSAAKLRNEKFAICVPYAFSDMTTLPDVVVFDICKYKNFLLFFISIRIALTMFLTYDNSFPW